MYNFENLNDYEFELLCKDIMEKKLNEKLYSFPRGPDGGIDICDAKENPNIVIQVKHYYKSSVSTLISALNKELAKVEELNLEKYYICTSYKLTRKNKDEIFQLFRKYMVDHSNIIDGIEINDFLEKETNRDIVNKHYKLWLCASNVLNLLNNRNVFIDCEELIDEINRDLPLFVQTKAYFEAIEALKKNNMIILLGSPGVGKSTLSKMLLLYYVENGYIVRYTTDNEISAIKKVLSSDHDKKELVFLDDFLGQHYLNIKDSRPNELKRLISYIKRNPNKKIILNSRITILNEAEQKFLQFGELMKDNKNSQYTINLDEMSLLEKAKILYNHLYFYFKNEGSEYFVHIKKDKNYYKIIKHKNYIPRIIEYVTKYLDQEQVIPDNYFDHIMDKLDNPEDIWKDEFRNRLEEHDRILMHTLYSLTDTKIDIEILEKVFNKRVCLNGNMDTTINIFECVIKRLEKSLIKLIYDRDQKIYISVINPSVNDFLEKEIGSNPSEQLNIIKTATYIEQVSKVAQSQESKYFLVSEITSGKIIHLECFEHTRFYHYIKIIIEKSLYNSEIKNIVYTACKNLYIIAENSFEYTELLYQVMNKEFVEFYDLNDIFLDCKKMLLLIDNVLNSEIGRISNKYIDTFDFTNHKNNKKYHEALEVFHELIIKKIIQNVYELVEDDLYSMAFDILDNYDHYEEIIKNFEHTILSKKDELESSLLSKAERKVESLIDDKINSLSPAFNIDIEEFDYCEILNYLDYSYAIEQALKDKLYDNEQRVIWRMYKMYKTIKFESEDIETMFEH